MKDHVSVCICTYHRNQMLEDLLRKIARQEPYGLFDYSIVVVDNDAEGSARETVTKLKEELGLDITYSIEREQTIPAARNHALRLAKGNYIAIIDDDEFPPPHWLITLYKAIQTFNVDGALGPVHPFFENTPPAWLLKGRFCERPVHRTGTLLLWTQTRTGNVLLKRNVFDEYNICFDLNCKTSGSDTEFFRVVMQKGYRFIAVEEAPVYEHVPSARQKKSYFLKRALVQGADERRYRAPMLRGLSRVVMPMKVVAALMVYISMLPFCALIGAHAVTKYTAKTTYHLSWLLTMLGINLATKRNF